jgi:hypothetical protein
MLIGKDTERDRWLVGGRPAPDIDDHPGIGDLEISFPAPTIVMVRKSGPPR